MLGRSQSDEGNGTQQQSKVGEGVEIGPGQTDRGAEAIARQETCFVQGPEKDEQQEQLQRQLQHELGIMIPWKIDSSGQEREQIPVDHLEREVQWSEAQDYQELRLVNGSFIPFILEAPDECEDEEIEQKEHAECPIPGEGADAAFDADGIIGGDQCGDKDNSKKEGGAGGAAKIGGQIVDERPHQE